MSTTMTQPGRNRCGNPFWMHKFIITLVVFVWSDPIVSARLTGLNDVVVDPSENESSSSSSSSSKAQNLSLSSFLRPLEPITTVATTIPARQNQVTASASAGAGASASAAAATEAAIRSPYRQARLLGSGVSDTIPNQYIVVYDTSVSIDSNGNNGDNDSTEPPLEPDAIGSRIQSILQQQGGKFQETYEYVLQGALITDVDEATIQDILNVPGVKYVEQDRTIDIDDITTETNVPSWGIDRIDRQTLDLDGQYRYSQTGQGVLVHIVDSGIRATHQDFASITISCTYNGVPTEDCLYDGTGHGTHVAGTVAGQTYGVAKRVELGIVKVFNATGQGGWGAVIAGLDAVVQKKLQQPTRPMVVNMSLGSSYTSSGNDATTATVNAGVVVVTSAGNEGDDACDRSPASATGVMATGSTTNTDTKASSSNYGPCVSFFAPGSNIVSASNANDTGSATKSGTSMASPHVAGTAALLLQRYPTASAAQIKQYITNAAVAAINYDSTTTNLLVNTEELLVPSSGPAPGPSTNGCSHPRKACDSSHVCCIGYCVSGICRLRQPSGSN